MILSSHADPRQRDQRRQGDRRPVPPRRRGRALRHRRRARHRPRQAGGAQDAPVDRPARVVHPGARRVPPPRRTTPGWPRRWACADDNVLVCEDGDVSSMLTDDGVDARRARCRPATSTSTASSATSATACSATGGCSPRRASSSSSSPSTSQTGEIVTGPEIITRGWVYAPEAEDLLDEARERGAPTRSRRRSPNGATDFETLQRVRPPGRRPVRQRPHQAPPDDRPRRHGGLSRRPPRVPLEACR